MASFEEMLTGGHPNSLGNTIEVVDTVLEDTSRLTELFNCYQSQDEIVRLRTSSALKRVCQAQPIWLVPFIDRLISEISMIDQASTKWTIALLFDGLKQHMSEVQKEQALTIMKDNLKTSKDWIVLNTTMQVLFDWISDFPSIETWIKPHLLKLAKDKRKSVSKRASKLLDLI